MQSVPDFSTIIHTDPLSLWPTPYRASDTDNTDECQTNHRVFSIANTMMSTLETLEHQIMSAGEGLAERLSIDIWNDLDDSSNDAGDLAWYSVIEAVKACHTQGIAIPLQIPLWQFYNLINQFKDEHFPFLQQGYSTDCRTWPNNVKRATNAQQQFRKILLPCMQAQLAIARKHYENALTVILEPNNDLISQSATFQTSLTQVRDLAKTYSWAVQALQGLVSAFTPPKMTLSNMGRYALFLKNLRADLSQLRCLARQAYFFDTITYRKQRDGLTQRLQRAPPSTSEQQKAPIKEFLAEIETQGQMTRRMRQLRTRKRIVGALALGCLGFFICNDLSPESQVHVQLQNFNPTFGNSHRLITQCPNPGYGPLSPIEEAFYRYESGEAIGKQMIVDLFLAGEEMTPSNAKIAFQLAIDDNSRSRVDLLNYVSKEFLKDFECGGNSILVSFIRHDLGLSEIQASIKHGASLEATLQGMTPLMAAILQEKPDIVRFLWEQGADARNPTFYGKTALEVMRGHRDSDMRRLACIMEECNGSFQGITTDLHRLVTSASAKEIAAHIASGAKVNVWNEYGDSPLDLVIHDYLNQKPETQEIINLLLESGATMRYSGYSASQIYQPSVSGSLKRAMFRNSKFPLPDLMNSHYMNNPLVVKHPLLGPKEKETASRKVLAHAFETNHFHGIQIHGHTMDMEKGGQSPLFAAEMRQSFDAFIEQYGGPLGAAEISLVRSILTEGSYHPETMTAEQIVSKVQANEVVQVHAGFRGHAIELCLIPTPAGIFLSINNKGGLSRKPVELYRVNPNKITVDTMQEILELGSNSDWNYQRWFYKIGLTLETESTAFTLQIEEAYPSTVFQTVGNCAWESVETAVYSTLALGRLTHLYSQKLLVTNKDLVETELLLVANLYSQWLAYTQLFVAEKYLTLHSDPAMQYAIPMNQQIMDDVFSQLQGALAILPDGQERFAKAEAHYAALLDDEERLGYHMHSVWTRTFATDLRERNVTYR